MEVEKIQQNPWTFESSNKTDDSQYLCQFTTLLMDTIEELIVRVAQIEFVCRQRFPDIQALSQSIQKKILVSEKAVELEFRQKEDSLLHQIQELQAERQHSQGHVQQLNATLEEMKEMLSSKEQLLNQYQHEKKELLGKLDSVEQNEDTISGLKEQLVQRANVVSMAKELEKDLLQQIELKDQKIEVEQNKRKSLLEECNKLKTHYKQLKSQYNFLISKIGDGKANVPWTDMPENETDASNNYLNKRCHEDIKNNIQQPTMHAYKLSKPKIDCKLNQCVTDYDIGPKRASDTGFGTTPMKHDPIPAKPPVSSKTKPPSSMKQAAPRWRDTRSRQELRAGDPHDDFLNTPLENVRNVNIDVQEVKEFPISSDKVMDSSGSDEETQDIKSEIVPRKLPVPVAGLLDRGFKYVEPVRKKVERENLKGVECQQCKKFYDAVLTDGDKAEGAMRCEHHDGVSRHRYRFAPPSTPEGFWNIGFDSDL